MKSRWLTLFVIASLNVSLTGQTSTLRIEAPQNQYGNIELDFVWLATTNNGFDDNVYFMSDAVSGSYSGGYSIADRSNSVSSNKKTLHLGELENGSTTFNIPITCGPKYLRLRYSNFTPLNHSDIRIYYGEQLVLQHTPLETGDWNTFVEEIFLIDVALPAAIEVTPSSIDFGSQEVGTSDSTNLTISNVGEEDLVISSVEIMSPFSVNFPLPYTIPCGEVLDLPVVFNTQD